MDWIHETTPIWDAAKAAIVGAAGPKVFEKDLVDRAEGTLLPCDWWRVVSDGKTVGYGWMDVIWGDAEMGLAVHAQHRGKGVGTFILDRLEEEAEARQLHYLYSVVRAEHPQHDAVTKWLQERRFSGSDDGKLLRSVVRFKNAVGA